MSKARIYDDDTHDDIESRLQLNVLQSLLIGGRIGSDGASRAVCCCLDLYIGIVNNDISISPS